MDLCKICALYASCEKDAKDHEIHHLKIHCYRDEETKDMSETEYEAHLREKVDKMRERVAKGLPI